VNDRQSLILTEVRRLVGLPLSDTGRAGNMRIFDFGEESAETGYAQFTLHVQCAWRIERHGQIWTGSADHYVAPDGDCERRWDPDTRSDNLQDVRLREFIEGPPGGGRTGEPPRVEHVEADTFGDITLYFVDGFVLMTFVSGVCGEVWRMFEPGSGKQHFVSYASHATYEA